VKERHTENRHVFAFAKAKQKIEQGTQGKKKIGEKTHGKKYVPNETVHFVKVAILTKGK